MSISEVEFQAKTVEDTAAPAIEGRSQWWLTWRRLRHDRAAVASMIIIGLIALCAILAPVFAHIVGHAPDTQYTNTGLSASGTPVPPGTSGFWFGTDELGRDLFVRTVYGAQVSLFVGVLTTLIGTVAGVSIGLISGYFGGTVDAILARVIDSVLAFPYVVLALSLAVVFGPSLPIVIAVISFFAWAGIARVVRGQVLSIKEREYIEAARSLGSGPWRIMFIDILPNLLAPVLVLATLSIPAAIVFEATLDYLGLGVQPPTASWGNIISGAQSYYPIAWWYLVFPAIALVITTVAFNLLGDGVRDAMDPRTERVLAAGRGRRRGKRRSRGGVATAGPSVRFPDPPRQPSPPDS
jgi:ABC-type dipeptide/oligopeptide/nickel transport system permease subunit